MSMIAFQMENSFFLEKEKGLDYIDRSAFLSIQRNLLEFVQGRELAWEAVHLRQRRLRPTPNIRARASSVQAIVEYCSPGAHCYAL